MRSGSFDSIIAALIRARLTALVSAREPRYGAVYVPRLLSAHDAHVKIIDVPLQTNYYRESSNGNWQPAPPKSVPNDAQQDLATGKPPSNVLKVDYVPVLQGHYTFRRNEKFTNPGCSATYNVAGSGEFSDVTSTMLLPLKPVHGVYMRATATNPDPSDVVGHMHISERGSCAGMPRRAACDLKFHPIQPGYVSVLVAGNTGDLIGAPFQDVDVDRADEINCGTALLKGFPGLPSVDLTKFTLLTFPDYWLASLHAETTFAIDSALRKGLPKAAFT